MAFCGNFIGEHLRPAANQLPQLGEDQQLKLITWRRFSDETDRAAKIY